MKKNSLFYIFIFALLLCLVPLKTKAAQMTRYSDLAGKAQKMSSQKVMALAGQYAKSHKEAEAIVLYSVVSSRFRDDMSDEEKNLCAKARLEAGNIYYDQANYTDALEMFVTGVKISDACKRPVHAARLYNNIGNVYCIFLEYEKGVRYYLMAYNYVKRFPNRDIEHRILVNLTGMSLYLGKLADAKKYFGMAEKTKDPKSQNDIFMSGYTRSLILINEGKLHKAITDLKALARYAKSASISPRYQCFAYQEIYKAYDQLQQNDSTLKYLLLCDATAQHYGIRHSFDAALKTLSDFYEKQGNIAKANAYKAEYLALRDSVYNIRNFVAVKNTLFTYEVNKTTKEISDLKQMEQQRMQTIRTQRTIMISVTVVALLTALFLFIVWRQKRRLNRSYADLFTINRDFIASQERMTERLRREHEVLQEKDNEIKRLNEELGKNHSADETTSSEAERQPRSSLSDAQTQQLVEAIQNVMENSLAFCDSNFSLDTLAKQVGSNRRYVSEVINKTYGKSFNNYVNPYRIHLACARFNDTEHYGNYTMNAIAESVGFKSYTSFVNIFRKVTGLTPSLYRKMASETA